MPACDICVGISLQYVSSYHDVCAGVKHLFEKHIVLHFTIKNTMEEEQLEKVCYVCVCLYVVS